MAKQLIQLALAYIYS